MGLSRMVTDPGIDYTANLIGRVHVLLGFPHPRRLLSSGLLYGVILHTPLCLIRYLRRSAAAQIDPLVLVLLSHLLLRSCLVLHPPRLLCSSYLHLSALHSAVYSLYQLLSACCIPLSPPLPPLSCRLPDLVRFVCLGRSFFSATRNISPVRRLPTQLSP